jgi:tripartite-type tricarboxylate transporter receptor subunit TctC
MAINFLKSRQLVRRLLVLAAILAVGTCVAAAQDKYPSRPITLIVSSSAGSSPDVIARLFAQYLSSHLGQPVIVEDRGGANGMIGVNAVAQAAPDGYTLLITTGTTISVNPFLNPAAGKKATTDIVPITKLVNLDFLIGVPGDSKIKSFNDFLSLARKRPEGVTVATAGKGSGPYMVAELLKDAAHVKFTIVPHRGGGDAVTTVLGNHADVLIDTTTLMIPLTADGKLNVIAATGSQRSQYLPNTPTVKELGIPGCEVYGEIMLMAPKGTPPQIIQTMYAAVSEVVKNPNMKDLLNNVKGELVASSPERALREWQDEMKVWDALITARGLRSE